MAPGTRRARRRSRPSSRRRRARARRPAAAARRRPSRPPSATSSGPPTTGNITGGGGVARSIRLREAGARRTGGTLRCEEQAPVRGVVVGDEHDRALGVGVAGLGDDVPGRAVGQRRAAEPQRARRRRRRRSPRRPARPRPTRRAGGGGRARRAPRAAALSRPSGHQYVPCARSSSTRASQPRSARRRSAIHSAASRSPSEADGRSIAREVVDRPRARGASCSSEYGCSIGRLRRIGCAPWPRPRPHDCLFCKIVAGRAPGADRRRGRAHDRLHGHQPGDARPRARDPARARRATCSRSRPRTSRRAALAAQRARRRARDRLGADGVNLLNSCGAAAWQTVFHFHVHVIPRYDGDPLRLPWVPGPGDCDEIAAPRRELRGDGA